MVSVGVSSLKPHPSSRLLSLYRLYRVLGSSFFSNLAQVSRTNLIFGFPSSCAAVPTI